MRRAVYADWNATSRPSERVLEAMHQASREAWGNPASVHGFGRKARAHLEELRSAIGALLGFDPRDVVLTSGGTESNNMALRSLALDATGAARGALLVSRIEHPSVTNTALALERAGVTIGWLAPDQHGLIDPEQVARAIDRSSPPVVGVSLQAANHETGILQPIGEVAVVCRARGVPLHSDLVQAVGKIDPSALTGPDLVSLAAHKIRGPKGIGAVVTRPAASPQGKAVLVPVRLTGLLFGGGQEKGARPGTQDPVAAAGFAVAAREAVDTPSTYREVIQPLRDRLEVELVQRWGAKPNGTGGPRVHHVTNLSFDGWLGPELVAALDLEGLAISSGAACSAGTSEPSPVIEAMLGKERALSAVRISLGPDSTGETVGEVLEAFAAVLER